MLVLSKIFHFRAGDKDVSDHHGKVYSKEKCGYKMVVYEDKEPSPGGCDVGAAQQIIDDAVTQDDDADDIKDIIKDALDKKDIKYSFLITYSSDVNNTFDSILDSSCVVQNDRTFLYLFNKQTTESPVLETLTEVNKTEKSWEDVAKEALCNSEGNSTAVLDALSAYNPDINWFVSVIR